MPTSTSSPIVRSLEATSDALVAQWSDGIESSYLWLWLRDHATDSASYDHRSAQRNTHTGALPAGLAADAWAAVSGAVEVHWNDGATTSIGVDTLAAHRTPSPNRARLTVEPVLWDTARFTAEMPSMHFAEIERSEQDFHRFLTDVAAYGVAFVEGMPADLAASEALLNRIGYTRVTIFGGFWELEPDLSRDDSAYTSDALLPHTDGTYSHDAPGLQLLHCIGFNGTGGASTLVDGFRVAEEIRRAHPAAYRTLSTVAVPGQYVGDGSHLLAARPILRHDAHGQLIQVSYNNADRAPFILPADEMAEFYAALRIFDGYANDPAFQARRVLTSGTAMLFDNWRVLHGRDAFTGHRHLAGGYLNHEDFESRLRLAV